MSVVVVGLKKVSPSLCDKIASSDRAEVENVENNKRQDDKSGMQHAVTSVNSLEGKDSFIMSGASETVAAETRQTHRHRSLVRVAARRQWAQDDEKDFNDLEVSEIADGQAEQISGRKVFNSSEQCAKEDVANNDDDGTETCETATSPAEHGIVGEAFNSSKCHPRSRPQQIQDSHNTISTARKQWAEEDVTDDGDDCIEVCEIAKRPAEHGSAREIFSECHDKHSDREHRPQLIQDSRRKTLSATAAAAVDILQLIDVASSTQKRQQRGDKDTTGDNDVPSVNKSVCQQVTVMNSTLSMAGVSVENRGMQFAESETTSQPMVVSDDDAKTLKSRRQSEQIADSVSANNNCSSKRKRAQTRLFTPGRAGNLRRTISGCSDTLKLTTPRHTISFRPTTQGSSDNVEHTTLGRSSYPRQTTPQRTDKIVHATPGHACNWKRTTPGSTGNFRQTTPGRVGKMVHTSPGPAGNLKRTTPGRTDKMVFATPRRSDNFTQITPGRTPAGDRRKSVASEGGSITPAGFSSLSLRGGSVMRDSPIIISSSPTVKRNAKGETELHRAAIKV